MHHHPSYSLIQSLDFSSLDRRPRLSGKHYQLVATHEPQQGPALLFVPGGYHGAWCYAHYLDFFEARGTACYAIDLPGQGALHPAGRDVEPGIAGLSEALRAACTELAQPLVLVGHSLGALPAMQTASLPNIAGLVLLAPSPPGNLPGALALPALPAPGLVPPPDASEIRRRFLGLDDRHADVRTLLDRLTPESADVLNDRYLLRTDVNPASINCPGLCLEAGLDDASRHPTDQDRALAAFLRLDYHYLPYQPHCMMYSHHWQDSAQLIANWYDRQYCAYTDPESENRHPSALEPGPRHLGP